MLLFKVHGQQRCERKGTKLFLIINNLRREQVVRGRMSTSMLDNDGLLQELVCGAVVDGGLCMQS